MYSRLAYWIYLTLIGYLWGIELSFPTSKVNTEYGESDDKEICASLT